MPPDPPREQGPEGLATPSQINATPTSKTVENPDVVSFSTGSPESQQLTGSQFIRICMEIYLKIDKTVKMYKNSY